MAVASPLVLCDVSCFLHSKQGKLNVKQLKSALMDFYTQRTYPFQGTSIG